jgi:hypothetical protein
MYKANTKNAVLLEEYLMTRRRDELLMEQGKLPPTYEAGTGPIPGTESERPALSNEPRITAYDSQEDEDESRHPLVGYAAESSTAAPAPAHTTDPKPQKSYRTFWR